MHFVKVGNRFINLDHVTDAEYSPPQDDFRAEDSDPPRSVPASCWIDFAVLVGDSESFAPQRITLRGKHAEDFAAFLQCRCSFRRATEEVAP